MGPFIQQQKIQDVVIFCVFDFVFYYLGEVRIPRWGCKIKVKFKKEHYIITCVEVHLKI